MKILIAPDKFKGSLSAQEVAEAIKTGLSESGEDHDFTCLPIADGGEGTSHALLDALGGEWMTCAVQDPLGREVQAGYAMLNGGIAVLEMSQASGLWRLDSKELAPELASTFGTGQMILHAAQQSPKQIVLGIGGSATNDGGSGMASALGFRFRLSTNDLAIRFPEQLAAVVSLERPDSLTLPAFITACDVTNPLLGENGATRVYGPQKGAQSKGIARLEEGLEHLANLVARDLGVDPRGFPGAGAAGGLGFGTIAFCGAELRSGFDLVAELLDLEARIAEVDLVITGEGRLDSQTLNGKGPHGVARLAKKHGKRVIAFAGRTDGSKALSVAFDQIHMISPPEMPVEESMRRGAELLRAKAASCRSLGNKP